MPDAADARRVQGTTILEMTFVVDLEGHLHLATTILSVGGEILVSGSLFLVNLGSSSDFQVPLDWPHVEPT